MKWWIGSLVLLVILVGCVPKVTYDPREGAKAFTMTLSGQTYKDTSGEFLYKTSDYELSFVIYTYALRFTLVNLGDKVIRVLWDDSAMVLPDGKTSRVVSGSTSWSDRNAPKPPSIIPAKAKISDSLYPLENAYFSSYSGFYFADMFNFPIAKETNIRVSLSLTVGDQAQRVDALFTAKP